jgi:predicted O-methyltransferase YrrM
MIAGNRILNWVGAEEAHRKLVETLRMAGLDEQTLRAMEPDDRVEVLEQAHLDPYDYIFLCC